MLLARIPTSTLMATSLRMTMAMIASTIATSNLGAMAMIQLLSSLDKCAAPVVVAKAPVIVLMMAPLAMMRHL